MIRTAAAIILLAAPAAAEPTCDDFTPIIAAYRANTDTLNAMVKWCVKTNKKQKACQQLLKELDRNETSKLNAEAATVLPLVGLQCLKG